MLILTSCAIYRFIIVCSPSRRPRHRIVSKYFIIVCSPSRRPRHRIVSKYFIIVCSTSRCLRHFMSVLLGDTMTHVGNFSMFQKESMTFNNIFIENSVKMKLQMKRPKNYFISSKYFFWAELAEVGAELAR